MKVVAVSQRIDAYPKRNEVRDALDQELPRLLSDLNLIVVPVPNRIAQAQPSELRGEFLSGWLKKLGVSGVVLSGGNDLGSCLERDETERQLLVYAGDERIPVLGICRGMQFMAASNGAKLKEVKGHVRTRHKLEGDFNIEVNSYHNQSIDECPRDYVVLAHSPDGEIEAIRHSGLPWEGWMWHPEREPAVTSEEMGRIATLFGV